MVHVFRSLGYGDVIADGFYDAYGDFPEVCEGPNDFPALENLRKVRTSSGDVREVSMHAIITHFATPCASGWYRRGTCLVVHGANLQVVLVDHELDQGLFQVEEMLSEAMAEANPQDAAARVRVRPFLRH
jgi:hypothetical protein